MTAVPTNDRAGLIAGFVAYASWGFYPFYFKALGYLSPFEIMGHRIFWSFATLALLLPFTEARHEVARVLRTPRLIGGMILSALIISSNWLVYVTAVAQGHVLEASLGYFLSPLTFVALALLVLRERLRPAQWLSVAIAATGVAWMIVHAGVVPKFALFLGISFSIYGLVRKRLLVGPLAGLFMECLFSLPLAAAITWYVHVDGGLQAPAHGPTTWLLLSVSGIMTVGPLWLFNVAAKRLPLTTLGMLQYIAPTMLFFSATLVFHEPIDAGRMIGFGFIWTALLVYTVDGLRRSTAS